MLDYIWEDFSYLFIKGLVVQFGDRGRKQCVVVRYNVKIWEKESGVLCVNVGRKLIFRVYIKDLLVLLVIVYIRWCLCWNVVSGIDGDENCNNVLDDQ